MIFVIVYAFQDQKLLAPAARTSYPLGQIPSLRSGPSNLTCASSFKTKTITNVYG